MHKNKPTEPILDDFLNIDKLDLTNVDVSKLQQHLKHLIKDIDNLDYLECRASIKDAIDDVQWYKTDIDNVIDALDSITYFSDMIDQWRNKVEERLTDEEREEFEQQIIMHRLKHKV